MQGSPADKLALITGGSSGIGLQLAIQLAEKGCSVGILSRDLDRLHQAVALIRAKAGSAQTKISFIQADVTQFDTLQSALEPWLAENGLPDLLINCAGVSRPGNFLDVDLEKFRWMMDINYFGPVHMTRILLPRMLQRRSGHLVYFSSVAGFLGMVGYTGYAPTKFAVKGFVDSLRTEIAQSGLKLSIVFPPDTETPSLEAERPYQPPVLVAMNENAPPMSAAAVAKSTLNSILRDRYIITPGPDSTLFFKLVGLLGGGLLYPVLDMFLADARRKVARDQARYTRQNKSDPNQGSH
jgi:3-dehydrosphinganine reductase